jgi:hypothetical protein
MRIDERYEIRVVVRLTSFNRMGWIIHRDRSRHKSGIDVAEGSDRAFCI